MRSVAVLLVALLLSCSIAASAVSGSSIISSRQLLQSPARQPQPPPQQRRASKARPPPPRPAPYVLVPVKLSGYTTQKQAAKSAQVLSSLKPQQRRKLYNQQRGYAAANKNYRRYKAWESNLNKTLWWNQRNNVNYARAPFSPFSDFTPEELARKLLMRGIKPRLRQPQGRRLFAASSAAGSAQQLPNNDKFDWSAQMPQVRNQVLNRKDCGSCYAHAALTAISSKGMIKGLPTRSLSVQQVLDCTNRAANPRYRSTGCDGGYPEEVFEYVVASGFIAREVAYPYTAVGNTSCKASTTSRSGAFSLSPAPGYRWVPGDNYALMRAVESSGPLVVYFNVEENFYFYDSGIYQGSNCNSSTVNHAMVLIGYDIVNKFWILRNSWGDGWGENGNVRVAISDNPAGTCGINLYGGLLPLDVSLWQPPSPPPPAPFSPQAVYGSLLACKFQTFLSGCEPRDVAFTGLASNNRLYSFVPLSNRNIVLYKAGTPIWTSGTVSSRAGGPYSLVLQKDGDLVGYEGSAKDRTRFWSSGTGGRGVRPYRLAVQNNGNVVLYDGRGRPLWSTGTAEPFDHFFKRDWIGLATSNDGRWLATAERDGAWWLSSDSGRTWLGDGSRRAWTAVAMSADGSVQFAAARNGSVFMTTNKWIKVTDIFPDRGRLQWSSIACSASGDRLLAAERNGNIWRVALNLTNSANPVIADSVALPGVGVRNWASVAMSADGMELLALAEPDLLYYSIDSGERWASMNGLVEANVPWSGAAVSGNLQAAAKRGGSVYHNLNGGASGWKCSSSVLELPRRQWSSVALATIGPSNFTLAAAVAGGGIYVGTLDNIFCRPQGVGPVAGYRYTPVGEVATGTTGAQKWTGLALFPTGAMVAAAAGSPWGIYHSMDGRIWMPRTRGLRMQTYSNLQQSTLPIDYGKLTLTSDTVVARPDAASFANFTAVVFSGSLIVPASGFYYIWITTNGASRIEINRNAVWGNVNLEPNDRPLMMELGAGWHMLRLECISMQGGVKHLLEWQGIGTGGRQAIPQDYLSPVQI